MASLEFRRRFKHRMHKISKLGNFDEDLHNPISKIHRRSIDILPSIRKSQSVTREKQRLNVS